MLLSNTRNEFKKQSYVLNLDLHKKCYNNVYMRQESRTDSRCRSLMWYYFWIIRDSKSSGHEMPWNPYSNA
eukprot:scaffold12989_cov162-Skeletonema_dohrnii-CCMP3373.AAC.1